MGGGVREGCVHCKSGGLRLQAAGGRGSVGDTGSGGLALVGITSKRPTKVIVDHIAERRREGRAVAVGLRAAA